MSPDVREISVIMAAYNASAFISEAINSILNQTFKNFELIVVNDGSTDDSAAILSSFEKQDPRVVILNQENRGVTIARNRACQLARGKYIAIMDADDVALPERLAAEYRYLEDHPEIGVTGSWAQMVDEKDRPVFRVEPPASAIVIKWCLMFYCCVVHSSVMMRREVVQPLGFYHSVLGAEDYDLWVRCSATTQIANIPKIMVRCRNWHGNASSNQTQLAKDNIAKTMLSMMRQTLRPGVSQDMEAIIFKHQENLHWTNLLRLELFTRMVRPLYLDYVRSEKLPRLKTSELHSYAGRRLYSNAISIANLSLISGIPFVFEAVRFNPGLLPTLFWQIILRSTYSFKRKISR